MYALSAYLGHSRTVVPPDSLDALSIVHGFLLIRRLVHEATIALLGLQNTGQVHLE